MYYQIFTRLIITSLILLGDSVAASEIRLRSNVEAVTSDGIVQISQLESHNDIDHSRNPIFISSTSTQSKVTLRYQTLATFVYLHTSSNSYELYHSRAPPASL